MAITPGFSIASSRVYVSAGDGKTPDTISEGFGFMSTGALAIDTAAAAGSIYCKGFRLSSAGALYGTTTTDSSDIWIEGVRCTSGGVVVYEDGDPVDVASGNPITSSGALAISTNAPVPGTDFIVGASNTTQNGTYYVGADPTGAVTGDPFGTVDPTPLSNGLTVIEFEANVPDNQSHHALTSFGFGLSDNGSSPPSTAFTSITFYGPGHQKHTFTRLQATDPAGFDAGTVRYWSWSFSGNGKWLLDSGDNYVITYT